MEITKQQYSNCSKTSYLISNTHIKKQSGKLIIPNNAKPAIVFNDDNSDENFHEYEFLGNVKGTTFVLVKWTDYNSEAFYLVSRTTGTVDTLIGQPVFAGNMTDFACINNPGTDEKQQVQVCELKSGTVKTRVYLNGTADTFFTDIACINRNSVLAKDNTGKYWKLNFIIAAE